MVKTDQKKGKSPVLIIGIDIMKLNINASFSQIDYSTEKRMGRRKKMYERQVHFPKVVYNQANRCIGMCAPRKNKCRAVCGDMQLTLHPTMDCQEGRTDPYILKILELILHLPV